MIPIGFFLFNPFQRLCQKSFKNCFCSYVRRHDDLINSFGIFLNFKDFHGTNDYQVCLSTAGAARTGGIIAGVLITVGFIIFDIWTIIVANNAKKEIEAAQ